MTTIESKKVIAHAPAAEVYTFLLDLNNFKELLPQNNISDWESTTDSCSFKVQKAYKIGLKLKQGTPNDKIELVSSEDSPFPFTLDIILNAQDAQTTEGFQICNAELNAFLKMMVKKPLQNLFDYIADKLAAKYAAA